jgi:hypothetical protein
MYELSKAMCDAIGLHSLEVSRLYVAVLPDLTLNLLPKSRKYLSFRGEKGKI